MDSALWKFNFYQVEFNLDSTQSVLFNIGLMFIFSIQHSGMARRRFKKVLSKYFPAAVERSTYIVSSSIMLWMLILCWQELPFILFDIGANYFGSIQIIYWLGWGLVVLSTFQIDHFHFFGIKQALKYSFKDKVYTQEFKIPFFYKIVRHPLYLGLIILHWSTSEMTVSRFLLALCITLYIYIGTWFEEKDLEFDFGNKYKTYKKMVPKLFPIKPINAIRQITNQIPKTK